VPHVYLNQGIQRSRVLAARLRCSPLAMARSIALVKVVTNGASTIAAVL